jgi:TetR/AcrR family transcriptional regulator, cholesterol catabolism regulator
VTDLSIDDLTTSQAARRQRVIDAALALGSSGGYEAVQMRDVARTAGVALGTIYRYFTSKDHLLAAAMVDWSADLERRIALRPPQGRTVADSVVDVIRRATRPMERDPRLASAMVQAASANEPSVSLCERQTTETIKRVLSGAMDGTDPDRKERTARVLAHVWNSSILRWANGSEAVGQIGDDLEDAARLLLD